MGLFKKTKKVAEIEYMHSYDKFPNDVVNAFSIITDKYKLKFKADGICSVDITNQYVRMNFNMDRYDLQGLLFKKGDSTSFGITRLATHNNWKEPRIENSPNSDYGNKKEIKNQLNHFAFIVDKYLSTTLTGNFDWYNQVKQEDEYERQLIGLILGPEIEYGHPISQKFRDGDKTWKIDIEKHIVENSIELK